LFYPWQVSIGISGRFGPEYSFYFEEELRRDDTGLFYFAVHGLQFEQRNYLVAVDYDIVKDIDIPFESLDLGRILAEMEDTGTKVNIVILDACRNNPYSGKFRSVERGLSVVRAPKGSLHRVFHRSW